jgi:nucleotidyltransferase substrate binding protein (TIGR01987 family)
VTVESRWQQRFSNYTKALGSLQNAVDLLHQRPLSSLERQGLIQGFEFTHELAWKVLKDFLEERGVSGMYGSKDTTREAFRLGLIQDGEIWMDMIGKRNLSSHTYDEPLALKLEAKVSQEYLAEFVNLEETMRKELKT